MHILYFSIDFDWTESDEKELFMTDCIIATDGMYVCTYMHETIATHIRP